ncbi:MAG: CCA tRNA nucleotidyltransferase [Micavibrio sp.]|nr:CCA tRNA nucleotidyltransferase [Micavibrio sp.]
MTSTLPPHTLNLNNFEWLKDATLQALLSALNGDDDNVVAMLVGGCIRNTLLGSPVDDIDVATLLLPHDVLLRLESEGFKVIPTGIDHGTVTAVRDGRAYEITTLRKDVETYGRHAVVAFSDSWVEDAKRRDFTVNTLLCDAMGRLYDPLGCGYEDLKNQRIVFVGEADKRIREDYLRILRYFRFHGNYGLGPPDAEALAACTRCTDGLKGLSKERKTQEIFKIVMSEGAACTLQLMAECGVLQVMGLQEYDADRFKKISTLQEAYSNQSIATRLYVMAGCDLDKLEGGGEHLLIPKNVKKEIEALDKVRHSAPNTLHEWEIAAYKWSKDAALQVLILKMSKGAQALDKTIKIYGTLHAWDVPVFPVSGKDLLQKGFKPGPEVGAELKRLEEDWLKNDFDTSFLKS